MSAEILIKTLLSLIPKDAFKNVEIEVDWDQPEDDFLLISIGIRRLKPNEQRGGS